MIMQSLTEDEKRTGIEENIHSNIFVEAGAGAGKTTLIVKRIVNQIRQGMEPEKLVVITFTNKAAGELFERIEAAFEKEEKNPDNTQEEREIFQKALENIEKMNISTIHSFCYKLLRERCFDAALPLDVSLIENQETIERQKKFIKKWMAKLSKSEIDEIKSAICYCTEKETYKEGLENIFFSICEKPDDVKVVELENGKLLAMQQEIEQLVQKKEAKWQDIVTEMKSFARATIGIINNTTGTNLDEDELYKNIYAKYRPLIWFDEKTLCKNVGEDKDILREIYSKENVKIYKPKSCQEEVQSACELWLDENLLDTDSNSYDEYKKIVDAIMKKAATYAYYVLIKYAVRATADYKKTLDGHALSNDELLFRTKDLICNSKDAVEYFAQKYHCIYVDEFQDTDHIQAELIWGIACGGGDTLRQGALFVVGDPKQAIYRFRGGEPDVYYDIKHRMSEMPEAIVYELYNNYRSNGEIISWVNKVFKGPITGDKITYTDMVSKASELLEDNTNSDLSPIKGVYKLECGISKKEDEAEVIANFINRMVCGNYGIYETVKKEDGTLVRQLRKIKYSDFLLLCWTKTDMKEYLEEMQNAGISVSMAGETKVDKNIVLTNFVKLFSYLRSPYDVKIEKGASHVVAIDEVLKAEKVEKQRLQELKKKTEGMNAYAMAQYLLEHIEYLLPWDVVLTKIQMCSVQSKLRQMVESVFENTKGNPIDLAENFKNYLQTTVERELPLLENQDAVQFMNLHKAKGLEGAITILMNRKEDKKFVSAYKTSWKNSEDKYEYYGTTKLGEYASNVAINGYDLDADTEKLRKLAEKEDAEEKIRLEYVAATRAKEVLVVMKELSKDAVFSKYQVPEDNLLDYVLDTEVETEEIDSENKVTDLVLETTVIPEEMFEKTYVKISPSDLEGSVEAADEETEKEENYVVKRRPRGNVFGTTMHRSFELLVQNYQSLSLDLEECVTRAIIENYEDLLEEGKRIYIRDGENAEDYPNVVKAYLVKALKEFVDSNEVRELLLSAKAIYTELPFSYFTSVEEDKELFESIEKHLEKHKIQIDTKQPVWVNGTADLVLEYDNGDILIIDYKSDTKKVKSLDDFENALQKKYDGQLTLYRYSMSRIFGVPLDKVETRLYHLY